MLTQCLLAFFLAAQPRAANPTYSRTEGLTVRNPSTPPVLADGFTASVFAQAPEIYSPCSIAASPDGSLYVAEDEYNSQDDDRAEGLAHVKLCVDSDNDGRADRFTIFAGGLNSPQGLTFVDRTLYVVHAPFLSAFRDDNNDGIADWRRDLVTGLGPAPEGLVHHVPSGVRMGIDGWLYISIGDKGILKATGTDGSTVQCIGGGIVRVRPDGTELELFAHGLRNTLDVAVSPLLDCFTRDNTNDGGGWNVRLSHIQNGAEYGYPSLFVNFSDEIIPAIADYGGGSGTGCMWFNEPGWPEGFNNTLYTTDWGVGRVYRHTLTPDGATFTDKAEEFFSGQHPVDIDADALGNMYICDWGDRGWGDIRREGVTGTIYRVRYSGPSPVGSALPRWPDLRTLSDAELLDVLSSLSATARLNASRELISRRIAGPVTNSLFGMFNDVPGSIETRVARIFTALQVACDPAAREMVDNGWPDNSPLQALGSIQELREFAVRAAGDRPHCGGPHDLLQSGAMDPNPRVRAQAAVGLGRMEDAEYVSDLVPLLQDADVMVRHAALQGLRRIGTHTGITPSMLPGPGATLEEFVAAVRVLRGIHQTSVVEGLSESLRSADVNPDFKPHIVRALAQLTYREADWNGVWWGTRPSTKGPCYNPVPWEGTAAAAEAIAMAASTTEDPALARTALDLIERYGISQAAPVLAQGFLNQGPLALDMGRTLTTLHDDSPITRQALRMMVDHASLPADLRLAALRALSAAADPADATLMMAVIRSLQAENTPADMVDEAARALSRVRDAGQIPAIVEFTASASPRMRIAAYTALLAMDAPEAVAAVTAAFKVNNDDFTQVTSAMYAIGQSSRDVARQHLRRITNSLDYSLQAWQKQPEFVRATISAAQRAADASHAYALGLFIGRGFAVPQCTLAIREMNEAEIPDKALVLVAATLVNAAVDLSLDMTSAERDLVLATALQLASSQRIPAQQSSGWLSRIRQFSGILEGFQVVGPLPPAAGHSPFSTIYAVEETPAGPFDPIVVHTAQGDRQFAWRSITPEAGMLGQIDLRAAFGSSDPGVAYLSTTYITPARTRATLFVGSDDGVAVWLNGKKVWHNDAFRALQQYSDQIPLTLEGGTNTLLFKVTNSGGEWGLAARIRLETGAPAEESRPDGVRRIRDIPLPQVLAGLMTQSTGPDTAMRGKELFTALSCANCHTVDPNDPPRGPFLGDAGKRFSIEHLARSILEPEAMIAQGFVTQEIEFRSDAAAYGSTTLRGFITSESGDVLEIRDLTAAATVIRKSDILRRTDVPGSSMPAKLADDLSVDELFSLIEYLRSLN